MSSVMDMSASSGDLTLTPVLPAAGSIATDKAVIIARIVRPMRMDMLDAAAISVVRFGRSSDDFASRFGSYFGVKWAIMASLALQGAWIVVRQSLSELRQPLPVRRDAGTRIPFETSARGGFQT
jgi:hypothetical protein